MGQGGPMPEDLWRDETQPGNTIDDRDEQCVAQKWKDDDGFELNLGLDDYCCDGKDQKHFIVCEYWEGIIGF